MAIVDILEAELKKVDEKLQILNAERADIIKMLRIPKPVVTDAMLREATTKIVLDIPKKPLKKLVVLKTHERVGSVSLTELVMNETGKATNNTFIGRVNAFLILKGYISKKKRGKINIHYPLQKGIDAGIYASGNGVRVEKHGIPHVLEAIKPLLVEVNK